MAGHDHGHDVTYRLDRDLSIPELSTTGSATSSGKAGMVMYRARGEASWMALAKVIGLDLAKVVESC